MCDPFQGHQPTALYPRRLLSRDQRLPPVAGLCFACCCGLASSLSRGVEKWGLRSGGDVYARVWSVVRYLAAWREGENTLKGQHNRSSVYGWGPDTPLRSQHGRHVLVTQHHTH
jgi:hypothetical protein